MARRVSVIALDGVLDGALGVTMDVLAAANRIAAAMGRPRPFSVRLVSARSRLVSGAGLRIEAQGRMADRGRPDIVVLPGLNVPSRNELEAALARPDVKAAQSYVVRQAARGALICAACSATFLCAEAGLLDGGVSTTSWWLAPVFRARYPGVDLRDDALVVDSGRVVTAGAALSQIDLMLWLVRRIAGPQVAELCVRYLVAGQRTSQAHHALVDHLLHDSEAVRRAEAYVRRNLERRVSVAEVARAAGTSPRTLTRRTQEAVGLSPVGFVRRLRAERAAHLLATTGESFDRIAARVGYDDPGTLRQLLRREFNATARGLRQGGRRSGTLRSRPGSPGL
jgi:transcriptional regulator GlxA family with amidase domain